MGASQMWEIDWSGNHPDWNSKLSNIKLSKVKVEAIDNIYLSHWREHCVECAVPECYKTCLLYVPRDDQKCARFRYGIDPNSEYKGHYNYGADITFRRWGKLEASLKYGMISMTMSKLLARLDELVLSGLNPIATLIKPINPKRYLNDGYTMLRHIALRLLTRRLYTRKVEVDEFLIEAWNSSEEEFSIIVECHHQKKLTYRTSLILKPGQNLYIIPFQQMNLDLCSRSGSISVLPDNDAEVRIIFTWLDFIKRGKTTTSETVFPESVTKIKCVVWDLDNTLWQGILVEDGPEAIVPDESAIKLIYEFDKHGIIQSISSKNDYNLAWKVIERLGLKDYFIYPAINWDSKSENIKLIAKELNISLDTFALIDDSAFERNEVSYQFPQIRTYSENDLSSILERPEFDLPVTEASSQRRKSYLAEAKRKRIVKAYGNNYEKFLETCKMEAILFTPKENKDINRCLELLQRSNQLNLSTYRYERNEFIQLLNNPEILCVATMCKDRFGNYGTVGFASIKFSYEIPRILDFIISCRVAKKKLENAWFLWLINKLNKDGFKKVHARFIPTERNGVLRNVLDEVGFKEIEQIEDQQILELNFENTPPAATIVKIIDQGIN